MTTKKKSKRGLIWPDMVWWIIALLVFAFVVISIILSKKQGSNLLDEIINFLRFGR